MLVLVVVPFLKLEYVYGITLRESVNEMIETPPLNKITRPNPFH